jgi:hypothetical protein
MSETIALEEAERQVALVSRRLGLLHLAFAEVLVDELGEEEGKRIITRAIKDYGAKIGEAKRKQALEQGLELTSETFRKLSDLPSIGMHECIDEVEVAGEKRIRAHGCVMGKVWKEYGQDELGRIYCLVDPASSMAFTPEVKLIHRKAVPDGDPVCELVLKPTTEEDRRAFRKKETDWSLIEEEQGTMDS